VRNGRGAKGVGVTEVKHTPAPWDVDPPSREHPSLIGVSASGGTVGIYSAPLTGETMANADLIAAAPDLLKCCQDHLAWLDRAPDRECRAAIDQAMRAAIAKAEGR
jgi:hypothetical protein